jgi:thymidylate kinase
MELQSAEQARELRMGVVTGAGQKTGIGLLHLLNCLHDCIILDSQEIRSGVSTWTAISLLAPGLVETEKVIVSHLGPPMWHAQHSYVSNYFYPWGRLDIYTRLEWQGAVYLDSSSILEKAVIQQGVLQPGLAHKALFCWLSSLLKEGYSRANCQGLLQQAVQEDGLVFQQVLINVAGHFWGKWLWKATLEGKMVVSADRIGKLRSAIWWQAFRRNPGDTLSHWLAFWKAELRLQFSPPLPWLTLVGPDGCGKSSVLQKLEDVFSPPLFAGLKVFHRHPGLLTPALFQVKDKLHSHSSDDNQQSAVNHYAKPSHGPVKSTIKLIIMALDWLGGYWGKLARQRARGVLVVLDRHFFLDISVDPLRYRYGGPPWLARLMQRLLPRPELYILLDAPVGVLQSRKQEVSPEETTRQRAAYLKLVRGLTNGHVVDSSRTLDQVVADVKQIIFDYLSTRYSYLN